MYKLNLTLTYVGIVFALSVLGGSVVIQILQTGINRDFGLMIFMKKLMENLTICVFTLIAIIPEGLHITHLLATILCSTQLLQQGIFTEKLTNLDKHYE